MGRAPRDPGPEGSTPTSASASETAPRNARMIGRMGSLKNGAATLLKMLGVAVVLALILLLVEVVAGIFLLAADALFSLLDA